MICSRCRNTSATNLESSVSPHRGDGWCDVCGVSLSQADNTSALLAKLSQLARFGLAAEDRPLLEPAADRD